MSINTPNMSHHKPRRQKQKVLFDSLTLHFSLYTFLEQFLNHMLFPLLLPWMVYQNGWNCLIAQTFVVQEYTRHNILLCMWNWMSPAIFHFVVISHFWADCAHIQISIVFPILLYCMHRGMVALKYATLSPSELRRLLRGSNIKDSDVDYKWPSTETSFASTIYQLQAMILSGYIRMSRSMINLEVVIAGARSGIPLRDTFFEISDPTMGCKEQLQLLRWQVFLSKALHIPVHDHPTERAEGRMSRILVRQADGSYRVNIHSVCVAIVHATSQCQTHYRYGQKIITFLAIANTAIPAYMADTPESKFNVTFYVSILFINFVYYMVMLTILNGAVQEMTRKSCFSDILESMIRLHDYNLKANVRFGGGGGGGGATDDRMVTSEIKTIQDLICENTDMIRLSTCGEECDQDNGVALRASLLSATGAGGERSKFSIDRPASQGCSKTTAEESDIDDSDPDDGIIIDDDVEAGGYPQGAGSAHSSGFDYGFASSSSLTDDNVEVMGSSIQEFHVPQIELLQYSDNFTTWMQCRKILHNFGYRFSFRLHALLVAILVLLLSLSLSLAVHVLSSKESNPLSNSGVLQTILWIFVYACSVAFIIFVAHVTNLKNIAHRETVNAHMLNMIQSLRRTSDKHPDAQHKLKRSIEAAFTVTHSISIMNEVHPIRIFGMVANARTSAFIMYTLVVFLYVLFQYSSSGTVNSIPT